MRMAVAKQKRLYPRRDFDPGSVHSTRTSIPNRSSPISTLQRTAGNHAVGQLLQTPLTAFAPLSRFPASGVLHSESGQSLDPGTLAYMESRFGHDFSDVRIHSDDKAADSAEMLNAKAYTVGTNVVFNRGLYSPGSEQGDRLLAHELAHVVQQSRGGAAPPIHHDAPHETAADSAAQSFMSSQSPINVAGATGVGIARDGKPPATRLSPEEMLQMILEQRGWTNKASQAMPVEGPDAAKQAAALKGKGLGHGVDTHSFMQVTDKNGKVIAHELGGHLVGDDAVEAAARRDVPKLPGERGKVHAERMSIGALERRFKNMDVTGGTLEVMVDQLPCSPNEKNCMGHLKDFADKKGLKLKVYVAERPSKVDPTKSVTPKTAARTAFSGPAVDDAPRTGSARVRQIWPPGETHTPSGRGGAAPGMPQTPKPPAFKPPVFKSPPKLPAETIKMLGEVQKESASAAKFASRMKTYTRVAGGLLQILGTASTVSDALSMYTRGTVLGDAQDQADKVAAQAELVRQEAEARWDAMPMLSLVLVAGRANENEDIETLDDITGMLNDYAMDMDDTVTELETIYKSLKARSNAMGKVSDLLYKAVQIPQGIGTEMQASEFALARSLELLSGTVGSAASKYEEAYVLMKQLQTFSDNLSSKANSARWSIVWARIAKIQAAYDKANPKQKEVKPSKQAHDPPKEPWLRPKPKPDLTKPIGPSAICPGGCHTPNPSPSLLDRFGGFESDQEALRRYIESLKTQ